MNPKFWLKMMFLVYRIGILDAIGRCHSAEYSIGGMFLRGHAFKTYRVGHPVDCYLKCFEELICQSYNFVRGQYLCELNNRTKEARPEDFVSDWKRFYVKRVTKRVPLGTIGELPAQSFSEIAASEGNETVNRKYWIYSDGNSEVIEAYCEDHWQKINGKEPVCFGTKNNDYGAFNMTKSGRVKTMKLVHRSGSVHCHPSTGGSYWGCTNLAYKDNLMTFITDDKKNAILPPAENLTKAGSECGFKKYFYSLDGSSLNSSELVFRNLSNPFSVSRSQEMQIWYGQDLVDCSEDNNKGKTCVDVYAWYE
ncbi:uncharacterized protein LOC111346456 isoform X2 [Stylophora pistillata]|nr:uncharacterized protein LOC111346456 isoform X2 [Stylophora pistillata]